MQGQEKNKPSYKKPVAEKTFNSGDVVAAVIRRHAPSGYPYATISLYRTWKTQLGKQMTSDEFFHHNEEDMVSALREACAYVRGDVHEREKQGVNGRTASPQFSQGG